MIHTCIDIKIKKNLFKNQNRFEINETTQGKGSDDEKAEGKEKVRPRFDPVLRFLSISEISSQNLKSGTEPSGPISP